ncbi:hypothetical protein M569_13806, partial [Genlisea aurea]
VVVAILAAMYGGAEGQNCGSLYPAISFWLTPCLQYSAPLPPFGITFYPAFYPCCAGLGSLLSYTSYTNHTLDCLCVQSYLSSASGFYSTLNTNTLQSLPSSCGVTLPFTVSTSFNCT